MDLGCRVRVLRQLKGVLVRGIQLLPVCNSVESVLGLAMRAKGPKAYAVRTPRAAAGLKANMMAECTLVVFIASL